MSLPASERHPLPNLSPQRKKERTLEALLRQLEGLARQQPVLMVFEDAHWIDPTSRELLDLTIERVRNLPVLLIVTFRPEFQPPWAGQPQVTMLALNRLDRHDRTALVEYIAGSKTLPDDVIAQIADRTDGVPLFVEELTKSVLESGVPLVGIPTTLHDSLMARLDRLASVRLVAQTARLSAATFPTRCYGPSPAFPTKSCGAPLLGWSSPSWCSSVGRRPTRSTASSTRWCGTPLTAPCCAARACNCTRKSPKRSKPNHLS
jgi:predicted ATPase